MSATSGFIDAICEVLYTNGASLTTLNASSNLWSWSTLQIGNRWLKYDPTNPAERSLYNTISGLNSVDALKNFFSGFSNIPLTSWCLDLITDLQTKIAANWDSSTGSASGTWNGMASQESSLIQSTSGQQTSTGDAESKACQSALQNASSAGQPASNAGDSVLGVLSNGASVQAQISA